MAIVHLSVRGWLKVLCALLFVFGVVVPCLLLMTAGSLDPAQSALQGQSLALKKYERKPLDYTGGRESADALKFQISELEAIRVSVRNELRVMDQDRQRLFGEVESGREMLAGVKKDIEKAKTELQNTKSKLSRASRQVKKASDAPPSISAPPQIVIVNVPSNSRETPEGDANPQPGERQQVHCVRETCLDFSKCPLHRPFLVYVYNKHRRYSNLFPLRERGLVDELVSSLEEVDSLTADPTRACLFVAIVGPLSQPLLKNNLEERVHSLPQWNGGANHVLIELPLLGSSDSLLRDIDTGRAIVAHGVTANSHQQTHNILVPPLTILDQDKPLWEGLPRHLPAARHFLIYFEGQQSEGKSPLWLASSDLDTIAGALSDRIKDKLFIKTLCSPVAADFERVFPGEWSLCGSAELRRSRLILATFSLVLGSGRRGLNGPQTYTRLVEALRYGAVPVIVGVGQLPLDTVIDWKLAAVVIPSSQLGQIHLYLKSLSDDSILSFRRQGRFLWETYFSSPHRVSNSVISIVRYWLHHPPPVARDQAAVTRLVSIPGGGNRRVPSPRFQHNLTVYTSELWNSPPGPFYMYPSTPFQSPPVSGSQYASLSEQQLLHLPQHVIEAGGITGPYFEDYLLGNTPEEQFTVVMLTYERNEVLLLALERLSDLDGLSKVVVVWNNPSPPPSTMRWPDIGVPLEVGTSHTQYLLKP
jgi:alpha-1,4-N-acetylglucosaminyltransferase EXTL3